LIVSLVFCDGFDHYFLTDILKKWTNIGAGASISNMSIEPEYARPPGGMGFVHNNANAGRYIYKTFSSTHASFVFGVAAYFNTTVPTSTSVPMIMFFDSSSAVGTTYQLCLRFDAGAHLVVATGTSAGTVLATSSNTFSANTWYHIEIKATIHNTTGTYEVRVNGSSTGWIPAATGKNTRGQTSNNYIDTIAIDSAGSGNAIWFDDLYFLSSSAPNNDFLGPVKIVTSYPSGAGTYADWTGNFASNFTNVQEINGDSDTTFNQSATAAQKDTFSFDDLPAGTLYAVQDVMMARQDAGAARTIRSTFLSGSNTYNGSNLSLAGSYQFLLEPRDQDPATGSAYTVSNFNAQERGYELVS
jgi:hypothetical protein